PPRSMPSCCRSSRALRCWSWSAAAFWPTGRSSSSPKPAIGATSTTSSSSCVDNTSNLLVAFWYHPAIVRPTSGSAMQLAEIHCHLMVSCQPVPGGAMDRADMVVGFALAALAGGARALRVESLPYLRAVRAVTAAPIVGIVKHDLPDTPVRITPTIEEAVALCEAGADIVAVDATRRPRPAS